tara:strand:- start:112 stop:522 length:411 start_codon:yes stop_codon:yes gene_type:complete
MNALNSKNLIELVEGLDEQIAIDWLIIRKAKRLPLTLTALNAIKREADKAKMTTAQAIQYSAEEGFAGFKASWIKPTTEAQNLTKQGFQVYSNDWLKTQEGIDSKAKELGVNINKCANYNEAKELIFDFLKKKRVQ